MPATAFQDRINGYEQRSDGLWLHKGKADIGSARVTNNLPPVSGQGVELLHVPGSSGYGVIQTFDRDISQWRDLYIQARNITVAPQGGTLNLPANSVGSSQIADGAVGTADIAANAVQQLLGSYASALSWSTSTVGSWLITPVSVSVTTGGGLLRIEMSAVFSHTQATALWYTGIGWDGAVGMALSLSTLANANGYLPVSWVYYVTLTAGLHTIALYVINNSTGTLTISNAVTSFMYVTEQKR